MELNFTTASFYQNIVNVFSEAYSHRYYSREGGIESLFFDMIEIKNKILI